MIYTFIPNYAFLLQDSKQTFTSLFQGHTISEILLHRVKKECKGFSN